LEINENNTNGLSDSAGCPSQVMTTTLIAGGSQSNLSAAAAVGRSRSES
jgi:hypothetical protein